MLAMYMCDRKSGRCILQEHHTFQPQEPDPIETPPASAQIVAHTDGTGAKDPKAACM